MIAIPYIPLLATYTFIAKTGAAWLALRKLRALLST